MKIRSRFLTLMVASFCVLTLKILYASCRIERCEKIPGTTPYAGNYKDRPERFLYCIWHDILLMAIFCGKPEHMSALVSRHQDGSYLADLLKMVGLVPIRGSSSRGGSQAVKKCLEAAAAYHISITPDGPRGPRHELKPGIVFLASQSGRGIVPVTSRARRYWRIQGRWTDMLIPKPFTKVVIATDDPIFVPPHLSSQQLEPYVKQVEQSMHDLEDRIDRMVHPENWSDTPNASAPLSRAA
ncbi:lysophospholipid acyltransferase family protein [Rubinisphaera margarita]|uniref:lysophospholipid acyltransferase family protein n=1 Tax=Rubinisphaera margarita TaxID=2909586 RepID=UPI001EE79479|nr:lysophospholipid acyltransferase family protein [Rubinisphaera margarita]MCG6157140.1 lysophospholipid acyltransferase family protein [Rubinisphaera margarita]